MNGRFFSRIAVLIISPFENSQNVEMSQNPDTSTFRQFSKRRNERSVLRFDVSGIPEV